MRKSDFYGISIRGRVAYGILCLEGYLAQKYPDADFSKALGKAWSIVSDEGIDERAYEFMEVIPEYLYEFAAYEDAGFEYLDESEYIELASVMPRDDSALNLIMHRIYDIAMDCAYAGFEAPAKETVERLFDIVDAMGESGVRLPSIEAVRGFSYSTYGGWGDFISPAGISTVIGQGGVGPDVD